MGYRVDEIPVSHSPRKFGKSKYRLLRYEGLIDIIALVAILTTRLRPFQVFSKLSVLFGGASLALLSLWASVMSNRPDGGDHSEVASTLILIAALWCLFLATVLVLFGYLLDVLTTPRQDASWRGQFVAERIEPGTDTDAPSCD